MRGFALPATATNVAGSSTASSALSAAVSNPTADITPPTQPTNLASAGVTTTSVSVSWTASSDNVAVAGYGAYRDDALAGSPGSASYTFGGLTCGTSYTFAVDAYDAAGNRSAKASLSTSTAACAPLPPGLGIALPAALPASTGTTFYVSASGSDANPGTLAAPWLTVQKAFDTLGRASGRSCAPAPTARTSS